MYIDKYIIGTCRQYLTYKYLMYCEIVDEGMYCQIQLFWKLLPPFVN